MGLKCSILGHSFEPTGTETERQEQGSEVVTVVRELEECTRCGEERVVSETTEVTTVVDADEVDIDEDAATAETDTEPDEPAGEGGAFEAAVDRSEADEDAEVLDDDAESDEAAAEAAAAVDELAEAPGEEAESFDERDPEEEDAEILTDEDEPEREPGEWPDDEDVVEAHEPEAGEETPDEEAEAEEPDPGPEPAFEPAPADNEDRLAGITVPEGTIVCPECEFSVDAESSYRDGDPCPECGAWLVEDAE